MLFSIRPNSARPDWPTEPDPKLLEQLASSTKSTKEVRAEALAKTQRRVLEEARKSAPCNSTNLDWIDMVCTLRATTPLPAILWIDTLPPKKEGTYLATPSFRDGVERYGMHYRYATITLQEST
jgi:hypothetical protein